MAYFGKILGGVAGLFMGGPIGAVMGAALGHAADQSDMLPRVGQQVGQGFAGLMSGPGNGPSPLHPARIAAMFGRKDSIFSIGIVALSAKLAKIDGAVTRAEIDAFKRHFRIPNEQVHVVGILFDQLRDSQEDYRPYARQMGEAFSDNRGMLEEVLTALFAIAKADGPITRSEQEFLRQVHAGFGLDHLAWDSAATGQSRARSNVDEGDPYLALGVNRRASDEELRAAWKKLMRENHPDSLAARGVPPEFIAAASDKVARINAAWDRIKRERRL